MLVESAETAVPLHVVWASAGLIDVDDGIADRLEVAPLITGADWGRRPAREAVPLRTAIGETRSESAMRALVRVCRRQVVRYAHGSRPRARPPGSS